MIGVRDDNSSGRCSQAFVFKGGKKNAEPVTLWNRVVIKIGDDIRIALGETAIAGAAQTSDRLDGIPRTKLDGSIFSVLVPRAIVDHENFVGPRIEAGHRPETFSEESGPVSG